MPHARTKIQQKLAIIAAAKTHRNFAISRLASIAGLAWTTGKGQIKFLIDNGFISKNGNGYICTAKGNDILQKWLVFCQLLDEPNDVSGVIEKSKCS